MSAAVTNRLYQAFARLVLNARDYGAQGDGTTDDTAAIAAAITAAQNAGGGTVFLPAGVYLTSSPLNPTATGVTLLGAGREATILRPAAGFSGAGIVLLTASLCSVQNLTILGGPNNASASNPATVGVRVAGATYATLADLELRFVNGYGIEIADTGAAPFGAMLSRIHMLHTAGGVHTLGASARNYGVQAWMSDLNLEICDTLDCLLLEDSADVLVTNLNGAAAQGSATNSMVHVKGACSSVMLTNPDIGDYPGPANAPVMLIEAGTNGAPSDVGVMNGVIQGGTVALSITSGTNLRFQTCVFRAAKGDGVDISNATGPVALDGCQWQSNNAGNLSPAYDLNLTLASGNVYVRNGVFYTGVGSGAGLVTNPVNDTNHRGYFFGTHFAGSGNTPSTVFATAPQIVRNCPGYNPRGSITAPTIGASPFTTNSSQNDVSVVFTALGGMTALKVGGTSLGLPVANVAYRVPARQSIEVDWTTTAPTWIWIAD